MRAFADGGPTLTPIGTSSDKEGSIFLNTQSWAVISGVAEEHRARQCMESVGRHLVSQYGPMLYAPAYTHFDQKIGIQSAYAPGWRNANVYFRPAGWAIIAACLADLPDLAFEMYKRACVSEQSKDILRFVSEPYVYPENVNGPDHGMAGRAQFQWNLGEGTELDVAQLHLLHTGYPTCDRWPPCGSPDSSKLVSICRIPRVSKCEV